MADGDNKGFWDKARDLSKSAIDKAETLSGEATVKIAQTKERLAETAVEVTGVVAEKAAEAHQTAATKAVEIKHTVAEKLGEASKKLGDA